MACNQLPIINDLLPATGCWINKNLIAPLTHLKVIPLSGTPDVISDWSGCFLGQEKAWSVFLGAKHCYYMNQAVPWIITTAQLNWTRCCGACTPVLSADWFMTCESEILKKTYHHSSAVVSVYRPLSVDDYYITRSLISGFCVEDKWKTKAQCGAIKMRKRLMNKHFNYGVKYKMKGNIYKQISLKVTFFLKVFNSLFFFPRPVCYSLLCC